MWLKCPSNTFYTKQPNKLILILSFNKMDKTTKINKQFKAHCQNLESNPVPLAPQSGTLPLDHRYIEDNWMKPLKSSYLTVSTSWVETETNKAKFAGHTLFNKVVFFCNILTCIDNFIWQFVILTGVEVTVWEWSGQTVLKCKQFWSKYGDIASLTRGTYRRPSTKLLATKLFKRYISNLTNLSESNQKLLY